MRTARILVTALAPVVAALPGLVVLVRDWDRIPDPAAVHFGFSGAADGTGPRAVLLVLQVVLPLLFAGVLGCAAATAPAERTSRFDPPRLVAGTAWAVGVLIGGIGLLVAQANIDAPTALAATLAPGGIAVVAGIALVAGLVGSRLVPASRLVPESERMRPVIPLSPTELASWTGRASSGPMLAGGGVLLLAGPLVGWSAGWLPGIVLVAAGLLVLLGSSLHARVDAAGLTVRLGLLGVPRVRVPLAEITDAGVERVSPMSYGGWGVRLVPGATGLVIRGGEALVVTRRSGRRLVVTVDGAATAAGLLNGLRARSC